MDRGTQTRHINGTEKAEVTQKVHQLGVEKDEAVLAVIEGHLKNLRMIKQLRVCLNDSPRIMEDYQKCLALLEGLKPAVQAVIDAEQNPRRKRILKARCIDLLPLPDIAALEECTVETVRKHLKRQD